MKEFGSVKRHHAQSNMMESLLLWGFFVLLGTYVIEGPLRYVLVKTGYPNAIYFRDGIAVLSVSYIFFKSLLTRGWIEPQIGIVAGVLLYHLVIGLFWGIPLFQGLFGFKIFVTFLFGVAIYPILQKHFSRVLRILVFIFVVTVIGVFCNYEVQKFPWEGINYETAFGTVKGTKEWWTGGIRRLPGLARSSFDAAMITGISGFACLILFNNVFVRLMVAAIAFTAVILTTTKGMLLALFFITLWMLFRNTPIFLTLGRQFVIILLFASILFPSVAVYFELGSAYSVNELHPLLSSLWDRFSWMWPGAFELMNSPEKFVFGGGLGSIGAAMNYGLDEQHVNAADNIFVLLFVLFGPLGLFYLVYPAWRMLGTPTTPGCDNIVIWSIGLLIICYGYGLTSNMLENPFFSSLLGTVFGFCFNIRPKPRN